MHSSYKLTKKKNISCIYHYTIINIIIDRYRSFQRRGSERFPVPKKKTEPRFERRDVYLINDAPFHEEFYSIHGSKEDQHATSTRGGTNSLRGQNAARITFFSLFSLPFLHYFHSLNPPPPHSTFVTTRTLRRRGGKSWRGSRSNCFRDSRGDISRAISREVCGRVSGILSACFGSI